MSRIILYLILFGIFFSSFLGLSASDEFQYMIKTMSWKKIKREIDPNQIKSETQAYALIRFHEASNEGKDSEKLRLLYGVVTGLNPSAIGNQEVSYLLTHNWMKQTTIVKLCAWKLYSELVSRKFLKGENRINFLSKINIEEEPVSIQVFERILSIMQDEGMYSAIIQKVEGINKKEQAYLLTEEVQRLYAYSLIKNSKIAEGQKIYHSLLIEDNSHFDFKRRIEQDYTKLFGDNYIEKMGMDTLASVILILPKKKQKDYIKSRVFLKGTIFTPARLIKNIGYTIIKFQPEDILPFLNIHKAYIGKDYEFLMNLAEKLISSNDHKVAKAILDVYIKLKEEPSAYRLYSKIHEKFKNKEQTFETLIAYLEKFPYNLNYLDHLIDFLADSDSTKIQFAEEKYWNESMNRIPNLPVKGRLVYWYLRYLKHNNKTQELTKILKDFYKLCPGSYYTEVIKAEFATEIATIPVPAKPLENKDSLYSFLSLKKSDDFAKELNGKDISFAYHKGAAELGVRLTNSYQKVNGNKILVKALEYFNIGEFQHGMFLLEHYSRINKLKEIDKNELYVGVGDISRQTYLSLFYTRSLMKILNIPDDPALLPLAILTRLYPKPHRDIVQKNAIHFLVEENVVYAVMRQESFFRENAISPASAKGLMQVMPSTGKVLAKALKVDHYSLHDPEVSIQFGTKFLADLLNSYNRDLRWSTIAYNGGPGNLRKWKRNHYNGDFNHFLEMMPSKESRNYCRIVISNYINYNIIDKMTGSVAVEKK